MTSLTFRRILKRYLPAPILQTLKLPTEWVKSILMTPDQRKIRKIQRLRLKDYDYLKLEPFAEKSISKVRFAAEKSHGDRWNYYSNALRREVVYNFQSSIVYLQSFFNQIDYLEIGSAQGLSMSVIGLMLQELGLLQNLISIDPYFEGGYEEGEKGPSGKNLKIEINKKTRDQALDMYRSLGLNVDLVEMKSFEGLRFLLNENKRFHLIYIDGSHEGLNPVIDFGLSWELLYSNGVIMLDDHHWPDVAILKSLCDRHCEKIDESWKVVAYRIPNL